jgi:hypothetical protein
VPGSGYEEKKKDVGGKLEGTGHSWSFMEFVLLKAISSLGWVRNL